jgi:hypothetical protein
VIDHLHRLATNTYVGAYASELALLESRALSGIYEFWMAEITKVEMIIGRENPLVDESRLVEFEQKDREKLAIAERLGVQWLGYPCSKLNDQYSRLDVSFRPGGPNWSIAAAFESRLEQVAGVSQGDARQVISLVHGFDDIDLSFRPAIQWLVTEDSDLRKALRGQVSAGRLSELANVRVASVAEFVAA